MTACGHGLAGAQTPTPQLQEVVVTAERVVSTVNKTPLSVAVLGGEEIDRRGLVQLSDLVGVVAGLVVPNGFSNMPQAVGIRGVGVSNPAMSQAVPVYIDEVPLVRGFATALWDLPDVTRIEVLRGPQGTLYGQNSTAGAVKIVSWDPGADDTRWASVALGNRGAREVRAFGDFRLDDQGRAASVALSRKINDGFGWNATLHKEVNRLDATQFRVKLKQPFGGGLVAVLALDGLLDKSDANTTNYPLNHPDSRPRVTYTGDERWGPFERQAGGAQLKLEQPLGADLTFRSITGYRTFHDDPTKPDFGGLEVGRQSLDQVVQQKALSQEFQLQGRGPVFGWPARWTTGAMVVYDRFDFERHIESTPVSTNVTAYSEAQTHLDTLDVGLYGQGRIALSENLSATAGLRGYRTRQSGSNAFYRTNAQRQRTTTVYEADDLSYAKSGLLPRLGVDYQWASTLLYASISEGAKFGGFNRAAESLRSALVATRPEKVRAYELGAKATAAGGRFTANVAAFYNDYRDYLAVLTNTVINGVLVTDPVIINAGRAKTYGVDLEAAARLTNELDWTLSLEWLKSEFTEFANPTGAPGTNYVGRELPYAPRVSAGSALVYTTALPGGGQLRLDASVKHLRPQYADAANSPLLALPEQTYLNAGVSYTPAGGRWRFSFRVNNLEDKAYVLIRTRIPPLGVDAAYYCPPRTWLFTTRYDF